MKSPFPGMDPYLESPDYWEGFHYLFNAIAMLQLAKRLPRPYAVNVSERVHLVSITDEAAAQYVPDIGVSLKRSGRAPRRSAAGAGQGAAGVATLEPVEIPALEVIEVREHTIEIRRLPERELVTAIELLSPANKLGQGIGEYRAKREALVAANVNVVEIDLLRAGARTELAGPLPAGDYYAFVFFGDRRRNVSVYAWGVRRALPVLPIPLREADGVVELDLAAVVRETYVGSNYADQIDYRRPIPPPPLSADDAKWAAELIAAARS